MNIARTTWDSPFRICTHRCGDVGVGLNQHKFLTLESMYNASARGARMQGGRINTIDGHDLSKWRSTWKVEGGRPVLFREVTRSIKPMQHQLPSSLSLFIPAGFENLTIPILLTMALILPKSLMSPLLAQICHRYRWAHIVLTAIASWYGLKTYLTLEPKTSLTITCFMF